jgi:hypothetical protein
MRSDIFTTAHTLALVIMTAIKDLEECKESVPDSVGVMKFTEVLSLGKKSPVDIMKKKYFLIIKLCSKFF